MKEIKEHDIVLVDGKIIGTIVYISPNEDAYLVEIDYSDKIEVETISKDRLSPVINGTNIEREAIETALLEAVWISRWTQSGQGLSAVLTEGEAEHIVNNIFEELDKIGYEIKKKNA